jgi:hypothetical protein
MKQRRLLAFLAAMALLSSFAIDYSLTRKYGGVDLRDKVVGARSLMAGRSMYFHPWRPGEPERFADPMVPAGAEMTRYTGTPFQSLVLAPLGMLSFGSLRLPWLLAQYAVLLVAFLLVHRAFANDDDRSRRMLLAALVTLLASTSWRLHVERGQVYILFGALLAALFWSLKKERHILTGALAAALVLFKPTYAFLLLPIAIRVNGRMLAGGAGLMAIAAAVFALIPNGIASWGEYLDAMRAWSAMPGLGAPPSVHPNAFEYPGTIEGLGNLREHHKMEFENGSIAAVLLAVRGVALPTWAPWAAYALALAASAFALKGGLLRLPRTHLLLLGFLAWTILMVLLPTPRFDYQLVHWIAPGLFVLLSMKEPPLVIGALFLLAAALMVGAWSILPVNVLLAEALLIAACGWALLKPCALEGHEPR